ncbi:MAG TPA: transposase [Isosphaeraceae bacterium]|nr:transposase [Isosphaeraceae bacterium]
MGEAQRNPPTTLSVRAMPDYRRWYVPGGTYFFTVVTYDRFPFFRDPSAIEYLGKAMREVRIRQPFVTLATVVLWDHLHCLWTLPPGDANYSDRWRRIKAAFSRSWCGEGGPERPQDHSRSKKGERGIWQRRFWEHVVQDEADLERHCDYIHYNPIKHGYVKYPGDWAWSSFQRFVRLGQYEPGWGRSEPLSVVGMNCD